MFDYVVVDAPHGFSDIALEIFDRSSSVLLVTELSLPSARAARRALECSSASTTW
jgi:Flp pilus assembly CpaE family ATPase